MSKEAWFREYERLYNEREDSDLPRETDEQLAQRASEALVERRADLIDYYRDLMKDGELSPQTRGSQGGPVRV
jgi:hypothetical protein